MACRAFLQEALRRSLTNLQSMFSHGDHGNGGHLPVHLLVAVVISIYQIEIHDSVLWDHSLLYIVLRHWFWSMLRSSNEISQSLVTVFFPYLAHSDAIQHTRPIHFIAGRSSHLVQKIAILSHPPSRFLQYMQFYRWLVVSKFQLGSNLTYLGGTKYIPSTSQNGKICRRWGPPSFKLAYNPHELWLYLPIIHS